MSEERGTPDVLTSIDEVTRFIDEAEGVVLGLDFDGTLSAITDEPTEPELTTATRAVFERVAGAPTVAPAVVSGRARDDLVPRVGVDGVVYAGNHGLELGYDDWELVHPEACRHRSAIEECCDELDAELADVPGCVVENKGITATVHFRRTPEEDVPEVIAAVTRVTAESDDVRVTDGKQIRELRPAVEWDKGRMMRLLADQVPDDWRMLYVGDDSTDEDAFRAIQPAGVGVRVVDQGERSVETDAAYRLAGQKAVPHFLAWVGLALESSHPFDAPAAPWEAFLPDPDETSDGALTLFRGPSRVTGR